MIIVDVESTGVDPYKCSLLSVGALDFDNPENRFYEECRIWEGANVDKEALGVNGFKPEEIVDPKKQSDKELLEKFLKWIESCSEHTIAGQNPSFDRDFLIYTAYRYHINWPMAHRTVDLHSIAYMHMIKRGIIPPVENKRSKLNLNAIMAYCGIPTERGKHNALEDVILETECLSRLLNDKNLIKEFANYPIPWKEGGK